MNIVIYVSAQIIAIFMNTVLSVSVSVSAETESIFRFRYRFRSKTEMAVSASFGFGRNEKKSFGRTLMQIELCMQHSAQKMEVKGVTANICGLVWWMVVVVENTENR